MGSVPPGAPPSLAHQPLSWTTCSASGPDAHRHTKPVRVAPSLAWHIGSACCNFLSCIRHPPPMDHLSSIQIYHFPKICQSVNILIYLPCLSVIYPPSICSLLSATFCIFLPPANGNMHSIIYFMVSFLPVLHLLTYLSFYLVVVGCSSACFHQSIHPSIIYQSIDRSLNPSII